MDSSMLLAAAIGFIIIFLLQKLWLWRKCPPGPIGLPIVGYLPFLTRKPHLDLQKLGKTYGNIFSIRLGSIYVVVLNDFESTKEANSKDAFMGRPPESPFNLNKETLETGAISGMAWRNQRRFSLHQLRDLGLGKSKMEGHIQDEIGELIMLLEKKVGKPFCLYEILAPSMSNNISSLLFGKRLKYDDPVRQRLTKILNDNGTTAGQTIWQLFFPWLKKTCKFLGIANVDEMGRVQEELKEYVRKEIDEHEATLDPNNVRDYIDCYLLEIQNKKDDPSFCKPVLEDLAGAFFGGGSETVRISVEWLTLTAAVHQDAQRRIQREIDEVVGKNQSVSWLDQKNMPYTQAFINEIWRWRTIIPLNLFRYALADGEIGGYHIPKGTVLLSNLWAIHHDPKYWGEDAEEFRPERFLTDDGQALKKTEYLIPFSIGKRSCPGEPMARVEVFLYFASLMQKFHVRLPEGRSADFEGNLGIGLIPKPQELIFTKRD